MIPTKLTEEQYFKADYFNNEKFGIIFFTVIDTVKSHL